MTATRPRAFGTNLGVVLLVTALAFAVRESLLAPPWTIDDAFITARYADHLAKHGVFAYNLDGPRVEGITSPLFAFVGAVAAALGVSSIAAMTILGIGSYVASGMLVFTLARELRVPAAAAGAFVWLYLAIPEHVTHATSGLETEAFLAAQLVCALSLARFWRAPTPAHRRSLVGASVFVCLLRPEGIAIAAVLSTVALYRVRRDRQKRVALVRAIALGLALPLAVGFAMRFAYFRALLPNTFFAKRRGPFSGENLRDLCGLAEDYLLDIVVVGGGLVLVARLLGVALGRVGRRAPVLAVVALAVLASFAAAYGHKDVMNYSRRFAMHGLPWLATLTLLVLSFASSRLVRLRKRWGPFPFIAALALASAFIGVLSVSHWQFLRQIELEKMTDHVRIRREWYEPARTLLVQRAAMLGRPPVLAVYPDAGYLPYRTDFPTVDFGRLNDGYLARRAKTTSDVVDYFFARNVDAVVFSHYGPDRLWNAEAKAVMNDPRFADYALAREWRDARAHGISLYFRRLPAQR